MAIAFACDKCGKKLRVSDAMAGRKGKCPFCGNVVEVPMDLPILEQVEDTDGGMPVDEETCDQEALSQDRLEQGGEAVSGRDLSEELALTYKMLSDGTRLDALRELAKGSRNVGTLCESLRLAQPTLSHHLALMRNARLVQCCRRGKEMFYSIDQDRIRLAIDQLQQLLGP